jgi:hypothetical protein
MGRGVGRQSVQARRGVLVARHDGLAERVLFKSVFAFAILWPFIVLAAPRSVALERFYDADTYYRAGQAYLAGTNPYLDPHFRQWPIVAAICAPMALLPPLGAEIAFASLSALGGLAGLLFALSRLRREGTSPSRLAVVLIAFGPPFLMLFYVGQWTGLCFAAYGAGLWLVDRRPRLAGVCFALLIAKPHLALIALPVLIASRPAAARAFALAALAWPASSLVVGGVQGLADFAAQLYHVRQAATALTGVTLATLVPLRGPALASMQLLGMASLCILLTKLAFLRIRRRLRPTPGVVDAVAAAVLAMLPYASIYDLVFVSPGLLRLAARPDRRVAELLAAWWLLLAAKELLEPYGGTGIMALIPPATALLLLVSQSARTAVGRPRRQLEPDSPRLHPTAV